MDYAGRPAFLSACVSSSFFVVSIGGQAGQSHFFLRVLQVIFMNAVCSFCFVVFSPTPPAPRNAPQEGWEPPPLPVFHLF